MKNIKINTKVVKKLFATGLLTFTMTGCGVNNEFIKEENLPEKKTEEFVDYSKEESRYEEKLNDVIFSKGDFVNENKLYQSKGMEFMTAEETSLLKIGDTVTKVPDRKILEEMGLDFVFVYEIYIKGADNQYQADPVIDWTPMYIFSANEYEGPFIDKKGIYHDGLNKWTGEIEILKAEYAYNESDHYWEKNLYKSGEVVSLGKIYSLKNFYKHINSYQKTK